jgi:cyclophilin family peptidyl-prolyl cis-trans isomerase
MPLRRTMLTGVYAPFALALLGSAVLPLVALDSTTQAQPAATPAEPPAFEQVFGQWKDLLARLRQLQEAYKAAPFEEKRELESQFNKLLAQGKQMAPVLAAAAERAYIAAPNQDKQVSDFLFSTLADKVNSDDYEAAERIAKVLIAGNYPNASVYNLGGVAAFNSSDFATARAWLKKADDEVALAGDGKKLYGTLEHYDALWAKESAIRAAEAKANDLPRVKLQTSKGDVVIELFENEAPNATANFISLVERKFYDGLKFHRVIPHFMAQGGDPQANGSGGPGYTIDCECYQPNARKHFRGSLSMAHAGRNTGGSQFFLTFVPTTHLDGKHTVFGRVIEGFDVLAKLERTEGEGKGGDADKIIQATVLRKRNHKYEPVTGPEKGR